MSGIVRFRDFVTEGFQTFATLARLVWMTRPASKPPRAEKEEIVILGNGPSLKDFLSRHKDFMENKDLLAVNNIADTEIYEELKPGKYVTSAPEYWLPEVEEDYRQLREKLFQNIARKTRWPMDFFIPVAAKQNLWWEKVLRENPNIRIYYYNTTPVEGYRPFRYFLFDKRLGMPRPHNVLIPSLMNAVWSGYKKIYITGADHNWLKDIHVDARNTVYLIQKHFYDEKTAHPAVMKKLGKGKRKLHEILEKFYYSFKAYHDINRWAKCHQVRIYNITPGSWIDAFERMEI